MRAIVAIVAVWAVCSCGPKRELGMLIDVSEAPQVSTQELIEVHRVGVFSLELETDRREDLALLLEAMPESLPEGTLQLIDLQLANIAQNHPARASATLLVHAQWLGDEVGSWRVEIKTHSIELTDRANQLRWLKLQACKGFFETLEANAW